jgi:hypothetical protein
LPVFQASHYALFLVGKHGACLPRPELRTPITERFMRGTKARSVDKNHLAVSMDIVSHCELVMTGRPCCKPYERADSSSNVPSSLYVCMLAASNSGGLKWDKGVTRLTFHSVFPGPDHPPIIPQLTSAAMDACSQLAILQSTSLLSRRE